MAIAEMFPVGKPLDYLGCKVNINRAAHSISRYKQRKAA